MRVPTQAEIESLVPPKDPANYSKLEMNKSRLVLAGPDGIPCITITLREIVGDLAFVQITFDPRIVKEIPSGS